MNNFQQTLQEFCRPMTELEKIELNAAIALKYPIKDLVHKNYKTIPHKARSQQACFWPAIAPLPNKLCMNNARDRTS